MTSSDIQKLFKENSHVVLPQGTQVLVDSTISIPEGGTLETEGNPTHYAKMARLIRSGSSDYHLVIVQSGASMKTSMWRAACPALRPMKSCPEATS